MILPSRHGLSIRAADSGDVDGVVELFRSVGVTIARDRLSARLAAVLPQPGALLVAEEWGPPTGLIAAHWSALLTADLAVGVVTTLLVDPERRRSGIGRLLLKAASQAARAAGCGELVFTSAPGENDLLAFCLATGFTPSGSSLTRSLRKRS